MTLLSSLKGSGNIPQGDKIRIGSVVGIGTASGTDVTVLTVASGGGFLQGLLLTPSSIADLIITNIKVTIDGASERTLNFSTATVYAQKRITDVGYQVAFFLPLGINFTTSLTVKMTTSGSSTAFATAIYSVK